MTTMQDCARRKCKQDLLNAIVEVFDDVEQGYKDDFIDSENEQQRMKAVFKLVAAMNVRRAVMVRLSRES